MAIPQPPSSIWSKCPNCKCLKSTIRNHVSAFRTLSIFNPDLSASILLQSLDELLGKDEEEAEVVVITTTTMTTTTAPCDSSSSPSVTHQPLSLPKDCHDHIQRNKDKFMEQVQSKQEGPSLMETKNEDPVPVISLNPINTPTQGHGTLEPETEQNLTEKASSKIEENSDTGVADGSEDASSSTLETIENPADQKTPLKLRSTKKSNKNVLPETPQPIQSPSAVGIEENEPPSTAELDNLVSDSKLKSADDFIRVLCEGKKNEFQCLICYKKSNRRWDCRIHVRRIHFKERLPCSLCSGKFFRNLSFVRHSAKCKMHQEASVVQKNEAKISNVGQEGSKKIKKRKVPPRLTKKKRKIIQKNEHNVPLSSKKVVVKTKRKQNDEALSLKIDDTVSSPPPPPPEGLIVRNPFANFDLKKALNVQVKINRLPSSRVEVPVPASILPSNNSNPVELETNEVLASFSNPSTIKKAICGKRKFQEKNCDNPPVNMDPPVPTLVVLPEVEEQLAENGTTMPTTTSRKRLVQKQKNVRKTMKGKNNLKKRRKKPGTPVFGRRKFKRKFNSTLKQFNSLDMTAQIEPSMTPLKNQPLPPSVTTEVETDEAEELKNQTLAKKRIRKLSLNTCCRSHKKGFAPSPVKKAPPTTPVPNGWLNNNNNIPDKNDQGKGVEESGPRKRQKIMSDDLLLVSSHNLPKNNNKGSTKTDSEMVRPTMQQVIKKSSIGRSKTVSEPSTSKKAKNVPIKRSKAVSKKAVLIPTKKIVGKRAVGVKGGFKKVGQNLKPTPNNSVSAGSAAGGEPDMVPNVGAPKATVEEVLSKILRVRVGNANMQVVAKESVQTEATECPEGLSEAYECTFCSRRWPTQKPIISHIREVHLKETRVQCADCGRIFSRNFALVVHQSQGRCLGKKTSI